MAAVVSIKDVSQAARREVERHRQRFVGLTASAPRFVDVGGKLEWQCDVRVGNKEKQGLVKDVLIAQWAIGVVNDVNVPVLVEKSESGRLTIIARSEIRLPNVVLTTYTMADLGLLFAADATDDGEGNFRDSFGHIVDDPATKTGVAVTWTWRQDPLGLDMIGDGDLEAFTAEWTSS